MQALSPHNSLSLYTGSPLVRGVSTRITKTSAKIHKGQWGHRVNTRAANGSKIDILNTLTNMQKAEYEAGLKMDLLNTVTNMQKAKYEADL